jgi:3-methylcrotonyl-CoA carboxylase alpha subunit
MSLHIGGAPTTGFSLWQPLSQTVVIGRGDDLIALNVTTRSGNAFTVSFDDRNIDVARHGSDWLIDGAKLTVNLVVFGDKVSVFAGHAWHFDKIDPLERAGGRHGDGNLIEAPMPGLVKSVLVKNGALVKAGDRLAVLEAMKMEHSLTAARDGIVAEVLVIEGAQVEAGAALIRLEAEEAVAA